MPIAARVMQSRVAIYIGVAQQRTLRGRACQWQPIAGTACGGKGVGGGRDGGWRDGGKVSAGLGLLGRECQEDLEAGVVPA